MTHPKEDGFSITHELAGCPFCGGVPERVGAFSAQCRGIVNGKDIHNTIVMNNAAWNRRAAPMEAVAWRWRKIGEPLWQFDGNREFPPVSPPPGYEQEALAVIPTQGGEAAPDTVRTDEQVGTKPQSGVVHPNPGQELRETVEIVTEWLAMAKETPRPLHSSLNYVPICASEFEALDAILAALQHTEAGGC